MISSRFRSPASEEDGNRNEPGTPENEWLKSEMGFEFKPVVGRAVSGAQPSRRARPAAHRSGRRASVIRSASACRHAAMRP